MLRKLCMRADGFNNDLSLGLNNFSIHLMMFAYESCKN